MALVPSLRPRLIDDHLHPPLHVLPVSEVPPRQGGQRLRVRYGLQRPFLQRVHQGYAWRPRVRPASARAGARRWCGAHPSECSTAQCPASECDPSAWRGREASCRAPPPGGAAPRGWRVRERRSTPAERAGPSVPGTRRWAGGRSRPRGTAGRSSGAKDPTGPAAVAGRRSCDATAPPAPRRVSPASPAC